MKLYHKQLNSVAELKREQRRLRRAQKKAETEASAASTDKEDDGFSLQGLLGSFLGAKDGGGNLLRSLEPMLLNLVIKKHRKKSMLTKVLMEVLGGYVKWKSIDLTYTLIKRLIRQRQNKKKEQSVH